MPAELRRVGGLLWWSGRDCQAGSLSLASGAVRMFSGMHCRLWPSPDGRRALALSGDPAFLFVERSLAVLSTTGRRVGTIRHPSGYLAAPPAWSPDGSSIALCVVRDDGPAVIVAHGGERHTIRRACYPSWSGQGRLVVAGSRARTVRVGSRTVLAAKTIRRLLESRSAGVRALAARGRSVLASIVAPSDYAYEPNAAALALVGPGQAPTTISLPSGRSPVAVSLVPDEHALWYWDSLRDQAIALSIPDGHRVGPRDADWLAWSPDGHFVAAATRSGLAVSTWPGGERMALFPLLAHDVVWTRAPASG